jgi:hypothetical protein
MLLAAALPPKLSAEEKQVIRNEIDAVLKDSGFGS